MERTAEEFVHQLPKRADSKQRWFIGDFVMTVAIHGEVFMVTNGKQLTLLEIANRGDVTLYTTKRSCKRAAQRWLEKTLDRFKGEPDDPIPPCAAAMGCLCACHAAGLPADEACDTSEDRARLIANNPAEPYAQHVWPIVEVVARKEPEAPCFLRTGQQCAWHSSGASPFEPCDFSQERTRARNTPAPAPAGGCGTCLMGLLIGVNGNEIQACDECAVHGRGFAVAGGTASDNDAAVRFVDHAMVALADVVDLLWPGGDPDAEWSRDKLYVIAERLKTFRPKKPAKKRRA